MAKVYYIGIMSGTSLDGIDIALCSIDQRGVICEASGSYPFDATIKEATLNLIENPIQIREVGELDYRIAEAYSKAVNHFLASHHLTSSDIRAIGSHGQTVWHEPNGVYPFTMQLGNPSLLAAQTGIDVVADFRAKDMAYGGQGAPFAPAFHYELFGHLDHCAVVNIGGMANITLFEPHLIGYDIGCGNVLMDRWIQECQGKAFDRDGAWARKGNINQHLLKNLLSDYYFTLKYPKSTGREYFNKTFLRKYLEPLDTIADEDIQATLLALTARSIANEIKHYTIHELLLCGGGANNAYLLESLQALLPEVMINKTERYGINGDDLEAMIFAWLGYKRLNQETIALKTVTGATKNTILGGIYATG